MATARRLLVTHDPLSHDYCHQLTKRMHGPVLVGPYGLWPTAGSRMVVVSDGCLNPLDMPADAKAVTITRHPGDAIAWTWHAAIWTPMNQQAYIPQRTLAGQSIQQYLDIPDKVESINRTIAIFAARVERMAVWAADEDVLNVTYEDIYDDRAAAVTRMCDKWEMPEHDPMSDRYRLVDASTRIKIRVLNRADRPKALAPIGDPNCWRDVFTQDNVDYFESLMPGLVTELGYDWDWAIEEPENSSAAAQPE